MRSAPCPPPLPNLCSAPPGSSATDQVRYSILVACDDSSSGHDLFVFMACVGRPWLRRVRQSAYLYGLINDPLGIVSLPGDHFILADLQLCGWRSREVDPATGQPRQDIAGLVRYSSATDRWDLRHRL